MKDKDKTKAQLLKEITKLRKQIAKLEKSEAEIKKSMDEIETGKELEQTGNRLAKESVAITSVIKDMLRGDVDDAQTEDRVLEACLAATDSVYGMIGVINEHGKYDTTTYNSQTLDNCAFPEALAWELSTGMTIRGIWGWPMLHGKPLICNDLLTHPDRIGFPKGHVQLQCFLGVPLKRGRKAVGMVAVANKPGGYTHKDRNTLIRLASVISVSRQHRLALTEAKRTSAELEQFVAERTKQLRESEEKYRALYESNLDGILYIDMKENILDANKAILDMLGYSREEILELSYQKLTPPEWAEFDEVALKNLIKKGYIEEYEKEYIRKDGTKVPISLKAWLTKDEKGEPAGMWGIIRNITERKRGIETLRESEIRFRGVFESKMIGTLFWDVNGDITDANDVFLQMVGYTGDEVLSGKVRWRDMTPPEYIDQDDKALEEIAATGVMTPIEKEYIRKDGSRIPIILGAASLPGPKLNGVAFVLDISERNKAEEALKKSERELSIRNQIADVFLTTSDEEMYGEFLEIILKVMESKYGVFGYLDEKGAFICPSMTRDIWEECQVADKNIVFPRETWGNSIWARSIREKRILYSNKPFRVPKGHISIERALMVPIIFCGEVIGLFEVANKATDYNKKDIQSLEAIAEFVAPVLHSRLQKEKQERARKKAEDALKESEEKYRTLFESMTQGVFYQGADGSFTDINDAGLNMFGLTRKQFFGRTPYDLHWKMVGEDYSDVSPEDYPSMISLKTGKAVQDFILGIFNPKKDDYTWLNVSAVPQFKAREKKPYQVFVTFNDITGIKKAEKELKETMEDLERSNKELEQFAYVASHDLQEPLRMVASYVQLLERRYKGKLDSDADEFIAYTVNGAFRMQRMIQDLLAYSRIGTKGKEFEMMDSAHALGQAVANLFGAIDESGAIVSNDDLPTVKADETQIAQLFQNLIDNAIKFRGKEPPRVHIGVKKKADEWLFSVHDNGIGIDSQYSERIFVIFQRLHEKEKYPGTGIGLSICKRIVERHGGRIWIESKPGKGATFFFTIPRKGGK